jgi:hypothetical protein
MSRDPRDRIAPETSAEELRADLEKALRFIWRHNSGDSTEAARARAVEVIDLLTRHLRELGIERRLLHPLDDIHLAFAEARRGRSVPLFAPRPLKGRPPVELKKFSVMMKSALAIDLLIDGGKITNQGSRSCSCRAAKTWVLGDRQDRFGMARQACESCQERAPVCR